MTNGANLEIVISAINQTNNTLKQIKADLQGLDAPAQNASRSLGGLQSIVASGFVLGGIKEAVGFLGDSAKAAAEDAASTVRLKTAVDDAGDGYARYSGIIGDVIKKGQTLGFSDDQTRSSLAILTAQTNSITEAMKRYALAQDLSRGANIDIVTASRLLGKVTDENITALNRYGISVQKGASDTELFAAINQKFHGQAQAYADTTAGKYAALSDRVHELKENIGQLAIPVLDVAVQGINKSWDGWSTAIHASSGAIKGLITDIEKLKGVKVPAPSSILGDQFGKGAIPFIKGLEDETTHLLQLPSAYDLAYNAEKRSTEQTKLHDQVIKDIAISEGKQVDSQGHVVSSLSELIAKEGDDVRATNLQKEAKLQYAQSNHLAADSQGNLLPTMNELVAKEGDSYNATQRDKQAKLEFAAANHLAADSMGNLLPTYSELIGKEGDSYRATIADKQAKLDFAAANHLLADSNGNLLPTMQELIAAQGDSYNATLREKQAKLDFAAANGLLADSEGNLVQTTEQLVRAQEDSINASIRQSNATLIVAQQDFPHLVQQARQSALAQDAMSKASAEANKELIAEGLIADNTASSIGGLTSALNQYSVAEYGTMANSPNFRPQDFQTIKNSPAGGGNAARPNETQAQYLARMAGGGGSSSSSVSAPGGSTAFFSSGNGGGGSSGLSPAAQAEYQRQQALGGGNQGAYLSGLQAYQAGQPTSADWHLKSGSVTNNYYAPINNNYGTSGGSSPTFQRI